MKTILIVEDEAIQVPINKREMELHDNYIIQ